MMDSGPFTLSPLTSFKQGAINQVLLGPLRNCKGSSEGGTQPPPPLTVEEGVSEGMLGLGWPASWGRAERTPQSFWLQRVWCPHQPSFANLPQPAWGPLPWRSIRWLEMWGLGVGGGWGVKQESSHHLPCPLHPLGSQSHDSSTSYLLRGFSMTTWRPLFPDLAGFQGNPWALQTNKTIRTKGEELVPRA